MFGLEKDFSNNIGFSRLSCCMISVFTLGLHLRLRPEKVLGSTFSVEILGMQV
jgi:hypothetical protein